MARNEFHGTVAGSVVQADTVHQVVIHPPPHSMPVPRQLPVRLPDFVGRRRQLSTLDRLSTGHPATTAVIVVLDGMAGVGKTSLAVHWAHEVQHGFPDGTLFVNLRGHGPTPPLTPVAVLATFLQALGVPSDRIPDDLDGLVGFYRSLLATRRMLILLDNASSSDQVRPLLPAGARSLALVTSRAALTGLLVFEGAHRVPVDLLAQAEAATMVRRIVGPGRADAEPAAVAAMVRVCARLPLALRIAANQVATRPLALIADTVTDPDALSAGEGGSVRTVFDWSYAQLDGDLARTFRLLGLLPAAEFTVPAVTPLTGLDHLSTHRQLERLADLHLIERVERRRYRLHDLLQAYAADVVRSAEHPDRVRQCRTAVLDWYARAATAADKLVFPAHPGLVPATELGADLPPFTDRAQAFEWLVSEHGAMMTAIGSATESRQHDVVIALGVAMRHLLLGPRALWPVRLDAENAALAAAHLSGDHAARTALLARRADTLQMLGRWEDAETDLEECATYARVADDTDALTVAFCGLGRNWKLQQRPAEALQYFEKALTHASGDFIKAVIECNISQINTQLGRHEEALDHAERELALRRGLGSSVGVAYALHDIAVAHQGMGRHEDAVDTAEHAIAIHRSSAATGRYLAAALETAAVSSAHIGQTERAISYLTEAASILDELGDDHAASLWSKVRRPGTSDSAPRP